MNKTQERCEHLFQLNIKDLNYYCEYCDKISSYMPVEQKHKCGELPYEFCDKWKNKPNMKRGIRWEGTTGGDPNNPFPLGKQLKERCKCCCHNDGVHQDDLVHLHNNCPHCSPPPAKKARGLDSSIQGATPASGSAKKECKHGVKYAYDEKGNAWTFCKDCEPVGEEVGGWEEIEDWLFCLISDVSGSDPSDNLMDEEMKKLKSFIKSNFIEKKSLVEMVEGMRKDIDIWKCSNCGSSLDGPIQLINGKLYCTCMG